MSRPPDLPASPRWCRARVVGDLAVSREMRCLELALELPEGARFLPGQFAMLHLTGRDALTFGRPFSLLSSAGPTVSILYRVVGEGTGRLAALRQGAELEYFGPLGRPFPAPGPVGRVVLVAGGVGLPPLLAWHVRYGRPGDKAFFGARDPGDVPWPLLPPGWQVSVDRMGANGAGARAAPAGDGGADGRPPLHVGTVTACCALALPGAPSAGASVEPQGTTLYACGPLPMLRAAAALAVERGWRCLVSVEEHMGCGYGVCRGCVVPAGGGGHLTACQDGPVLSAEAIDWARFGRRETPPAPVAGGVGSQGAAASGAPSPGSGGGT